MSTKMRLLGSVTSPFVRKVRMVVHELDLGSVVHFELTEAKSPTPELLRLSPIGKIPILILSEEEAVFESDLISRYLANRFENSTLFPSSFDLCFEKSLALINGGMDAAAALVMESWKSPKLQDKGIIDRQKSRLVRIISYLEESGIPPVPLYINFALGSLLGYLDFRNPVESWGEMAPTLQRWFYDIRETDIYKATAPTAA